MDETAKLKLPYIMPSQAQKHVTHNEALRALDAIVHIGVADRDRNEPPAEPAQGQRHLVGAAPVGAFAGHAGEIAAFQDGAWAFYAPQPGWLVWDEQAQSLVAYDGAGWAIAVNLQLLPMVGINASADAVNRLASASAATLLTHDGAGHQLKINKAAVADTASLLFQTGFSGRAEMGLAGNDDFSIKVSADGASWHTAISLDGDSGKVGIGTAAPSEALDVDGVVRSSTGFKIGEAVLQNGANEFQLNTSAHFSTSGRFAVGTVPVTPSAIRVFAPSNLSNQHAIAAYGTSASLPRFVVQGDGGIGIGVEAAHASALVDMVSTERGFLPPRMTTAQRNAIAAPATGLTIFNTSEAAPQVWDGSGWTGSRQLKARSFTVGTLPSAAEEGAGALVHVSDEAGGATLAFSDGTDWRRVTDRATVS